MLSLWLPPARCRRGQTESSLSTLSSTPSLIALTVFCSRSRGHSLTEHRLVRNTLMAPNHVRTYSIIKVGVIPKSEPCCLVAQSCLFCDPTDCSPLDSSVYGISEAGILECVAISFSRGYSNSGMEPVSPALAGGSSLLPEDTREAPYTHMYVGIRQAATLFPGFLFVLSQEYLS